MLLKIPLEQSNIPPQKLLKISTHYSDFLDSWKMNLNSFKEKVSTSRELWEWQDHLRSFSEISEYKIISYGIQSIYF